MILTEGDNVVLRRGGSRLEIPYTPAVYHVLKAVAHVPLAFLDVILAPHAGDDTLNDATLARAARVPAADRRKAEPTLATYGLEPEAARAVPQDLRRMQRIPRFGRKGAAMPAREKVKFARRMTPTVMRTRRCVQRLNALTRTSGAWRSEMSPDEWKALKVVILGSALPRKQSLTVQYFARLLGEPGEGPRIIYAESIRDEATALDQMATRALDTTIGVDFFNDPTRMHRDLLSDAAQDYLPLLIDRP